MPPAQQVQRVLPAHKVHKALLVHKAQRVPQAHKAHKALLVHKAQQALLALKAHKALPVHKALLALKAHKALPVHKALLALKVHKALLVHKVLQAKFPLAQKVRHSRRARQTAAQLLQVAHLRSAPSSTAQHRIRPQAAAAMLCRCSKARRLARAMRACSPRLETRSKLSAAQSAVCSRLFRQARAVQAPFRAELAAFKLAQVPFQVV